MCASSAEFARRLEERSFGPGIEISMPGTAPVGATARAASRAVAALHPFL